MLDLTNILLTLPKQIGMENMRILAIIPDRGDRPEFLGNCLRMIKNQTIECNILIQNQKPLSDECDITYRYRTGYEQASKFNYDCILFIENDDWYASNYIETMVKNWISNGKPDIFGTNYTYYYHIGLKKFHKLFHPRRASAMNTLIKQGLEINWGKDNYPYTDIVLWNQLKGVTFSPDPIISVGIKHNIGKSGGHYHNNRFELYQNDDSEFEFLKSTLDTESFTFYKNLHEKIQSNF